MSGKRTPSEVPAGAGRRLARAGLAGAGVLARTALAEARKAGAGPAAREAIDAATREANALQIFNAMGRLKGAFLKVGQILSQQSHTLPEAYVRRLAELQRQALPMHGTFARIQLRNELGRPPEEAFAAWEREPFAAASLGQVHRARLKGGEAVAVKIPVPRHRARPRERFRHPARPPADGAPGGPPARAGAGGRRGGAASRPGDGLPAGDGRPGGIRPAAGRG